VDATEGPVPFARPRAETPVAWVAGLAFGVLCIAAALVFVVAYAVVALARAVGRPVRRWIREVRQPSVGPATR
jgi:flagellar biogenesis protein FliO